MEARTGIAIALLLVGCTQLQISDESSEPIAAVSPTVAPRPVPQQREAPRRLKLRLTLDQPEDLKVKVQDSVVKGQVISDRSFTRNRLAQERQSLLVKLEQLKTKTVMVPTSHAIEQAEVAQARLSVEQARAAISNFQTYSPWTQYAREALPLAEDMELTALEDQYQQERAKLAISVAELQVARSKQQTLQQDTFAQQTELFQRLRDAEEKLESLGAAKSPYDGIVKAIKWLGQTDQNLQVELSLFTQPAPS
ncbi:MAG: efflux RND transporter periplasmic adaptor subunit [Thermosynechococcaceae cyanobacterium]